MAVTLPPDTLAAELGIDTTRATRLLGVATAVVEEYAPATPEALQNEAAIRFAGYLAESRFGAVSTRTVGPLTAEHVTNHAAAFRNSGAAALLTRYKVRRAGAIGGAAGRPAGRTAGVIEWPGL